jgi:hypothetical protein
MTLNYQMIVKGYPNQTEWLAVRFPIMKLSLYLTENHPCRQAPLVFQKTKQNKKKQNKERITIKCSYHTRSMVQCQSMSSLYSLIRDCFMIWRLIKDFKSDIVFSAGFDYDIDYYCI